MQRFGSALQLNVHFHVLVPDGAFDDDGVFVADEAPDDNDVHKLLLRAGRKVIAVLQRSFNEHNDDSRRREVDRLLASLDAASATPSPALFPRTDRRAPLSAFIDGFSLHAATRVMASDRRGLWRLCAYGARGAVASRLSELSDGRFAYDMKRALPDGRHRLVMTGVELLEKLVPLIPPTYANLTRFSRPRAACAHRLCPGRRRSVHAGRQLQRDGCPVRGSVRRDQRKCTMTATSCRLVSTSSTPSPSMSTARASLHAAAGAHAGTAIPPAMPPALALPTP